MTRVFRVVRFVDCPYPIGPWFVLGESTEDSWEWVVLSEHDTRREANLRVAEWTRRQQAITVGTRSRKTNPP